MAGESRDGVPLTHLDEPLFDGSGATKRDLVTYVEQLADRMVTHLRDRPLSVIRVRAGQPPFMQKNLPAYAPEWVESVVIWAERTKRDVTYALANDRRTLVWFANQRAVEYHPGLMTTHDPHQTHLILDLDPPSDLDPADGFRKAVLATDLVHRTLDELGLAGVAKTSGAKGMHVFVPLASASTAAVAAATRAIAVRAERLDPVLATTEFVVQERHGRVFVDSTRAGGGHGHRGLQPAHPAGGAGLLPRRVAGPRRGQPAGLHPSLGARAARRPRRLGRADARAAVAPNGPRRGGHEIPIARVAAMHEGKRRARERRQPR